MSCHYSVLFWPWHEASIDALISKVHPPFVLYSDVPFPRDAPPPVITPPPLPSPCSLLFPHFPPGVGFLIQC